MAYCYFCDTSGQLLPAGETQIPNRRCAICHSVERHRLIAPLLHGFLRASNHIFLEIGVSYPLEYYRRMLGLTRLITLDRERPASIRAEIGFLPLRSDSVGAVMTLHTLEHVHDDLAALVECHRILRPGGVFIIQVPLGASPRTDEGTDLAPHVRRLRFGQEDHLRLYGEQDLSDLLVATGFHDVRTWPASTLAVERPHPYLARAHIAPTERVFIASKPGGSLAPALVEDATTLLVEPFNRNEVAH